ncbi:MAG TPA: hypothetical protein VKG43_08065 [Acidimicrobiales bacterium]|nr:hypothetical protein [Acidimicrobiales bacterium]
MESGGRPAPGEPGRRGRDPFGRRALWWLPPTGAPDADAPGPAAGRRALFSGPVVGDEAAGHGCVVVGCERCGVTSRIGLVDLLRYQLPVGWWLPRGRFDHKMTCPACRRHVWASVTLRRR